MATDKKNFTFYLSADAVSKASDRVDKVKKKKNTSLSQEIEKFLKGFAKKAVIFIIIITFLSSCGVARPTHGCKATYGMSGY